MSQETVCVHRLPDLGSMGLSDYRIVAHTSTRDELRNALSSAKPRVLIIDLDEEDATYAIVEALEVLPDLCIVGATDQRDPQCIVNAVRSGCRQLTTKPLDLNDLIVAIRRVLNETAETQQSNRTIAVMNTCGGSGATTIACHLALAMAQVTTKPTLLIDLDLEFGGVARAFNLEPVHSIADIASAGAIDTVLLQKAAATVKDGLAVLPRPRSIEETQTLDENLLNNVIRTAKRAYSNIILDLPRRLDALTGSSLEECDELLLVAQLTVPAIDNARRLLETLLRAGMAADKIEIVLNRYRKNVHTLTIDVVENTLGRKLFGIIPNDFQGVSSAIDLGHPMNTRGEVYKAITQICCKLEGQATETAKGGWLTRLKNRITAPPIAARS